MIVTKIYMTIVCKPHTPLSNFSDSYSKSLLRAALLVLFSCSFMLSNLHAQNGIWVRADKEYRMGAYSEAAISYENALQASGNPFVSPTTILTNINGGLGAWVGYGVSLDTAVFYE